MKRILACTLLIALTLGATAAVVTPTTRATEWLHRLQTGTIDRTQLIPAVDQGLTPAVVTQVAGQLGPLGDPVAMKLVETKAPVAGNTAYIFKVDFKNDSTVYFIFVLDTSGKISGLRFSNAE
jgi:hypothetical protein